MIVLENQSKSAAKHPFLERGSRHVVHSQVGFENLIRGSFYPFLIFRIGYLPMSAFKSTLLLLSTLLFSCTFACIPTVDRKYFCSIANN